MAKKSLNDHYIFTHIPGRGWRLTHKDTQGVLPAYELDICFADFCSDLGLGLELSSCITYALGKVPMCARTTDFKFRLYGNNINIYFWCPDYDY